MLSAQNFLFATIVLVIALVVSLVAAPAGGDVSELFSVAAYRCAGWDFGIARGFCSPGVLDPNGLQSMENMKAAGIRYVDMYHFPCIGRSAAEQVEESANHYAQYLRHGSMIWFDIETNPSPGCQWRGQAENCQFIGQLIDAARANGLNAGVYSSPYEWESVAGAGCTVGVDKGMQLWYATYSGSEDFSDFRSFGGWTKPAMHQWADNGNACGISFDKNWYP